MSNRFISTFFAVIFTLFITTPMVVTVLEESFDVSVYFSMNEEEKTESETSQKTIKLISLETLKQDSFVFNYKNTTVVTPCVTDYSQLFAENTSPPPEFL